MEEFCTVTCPHCLQSITIPVPDPLARAGSFDYDCEVCCRSLLVHWERAEDDYAFSAHAEAAEA